MKPALAALAALALALATPGCLGLFEDDAPGEQVDANQRRANELLGDRGRERLEDLVALRPKNYTIAGTQELPSVKTWWNASIGVESNAAVEGASDDGGMDWNGVVKTTDVTPFVPAGQATEIKIKLWWDAAEGRSVDYDIFVDVPGLQTSHTQVSEDMNWNRPTKTMVVNTVGVPGANHLVGVQAANGRTVSDIPFVMELTFSYEKDAIGPGVAYALDVPANATGLVFESAKAGGAEHITAKFVVVGPNDEKVSFQDYNDLAIPLEQVFVPVTQPGEHVVFVYEMRGGFLNVKADVPLEQGAMRILPVAWGEFVVDSAAPAPGVVERSWLSPAVNQSTPLTGGEQKSFDLSAGFPLLVAAHVDASGSAGFTGAVQARIESPRGLVHDYQRVLRLDAEQGTLGYTDDEAPNSVFHFQNVDRGAWKITIVNDCNCQVGHRVLTYTR